MPTTTNPPRSAPYVAPAAPRSPRVVAIGSAIVALLAIVAALTGYKALDSITAEQVLAIVAGVFTVVGLAQDRAARAEQRAGVPALEAAKAEIPASALAGDSAEVLADDIEDRTTQPRESV